MQDENQQGVLADEGDRAIPFSVKAGQERLPCAVEEGAYRRAPEEIGEVLDDGEHVAGRNLALRIEKAWVAPKVMRREEEGEKYRRGRRRSEAEVKYERYAAQPHAAYRDGAFVVTAEEVHKRIEQYHRRDEVQHTECDEGACDAQHVLVEQSDVGI